MNAIQIDSSRIGAGHPVYIVAEISANHGQRLEDALRLVEASHAAGANAVKLQTYTPDTLTIECDREEFQIRRHPLWAGRTLYRLYEEAFTPWEWHERLRDRALELGLDFFSSAFDPTSVDFLEELEVPAYKIASFELVDHPLLERVAATGKPVILSTGMATLGEIESSVEVLRRSGCRELALLKCTSAYPAPAAAANLRTIPHLAAAFQVPTGLSDHTLGTAVPVAAAALGAHLIEKHLTLSRDIPGPDSAFSLEPDEFRQMVDAVRTAEAALGQVQYGLNESQAGSRMYRRSLFVVRDMQAGETITEEHVRSIRPGHGLPPSHLSEIIGRPAARDIARGTPLTWRDVA